MIKSHHNVGGIPDVISFEEIVEPLRDLFKDEVRKAGTQLGIPYELVWRQPFPGPGLAVRVIGEITKDKLDILREADAIFREEISNARLEKETNQRIKDQYTSHLIFGLDYTYIFNNQNVRFIKDFFSFIEFILFQLLFKFKIYLFTKNS